MSGHAPRRSIIAAVALLVIRSVAAAFSIGALDTHALAPGEPLDARLPLFFETYENPQAALLAAGDHPRHAPLPPAATLMTFPVRELYVHATPARPPGSTTPGPSAPTLPRGYAFPAAAPTTPQAKPATEPPAKTIPQPASLLGATPGPAPHTPPPAGLQGTLHGLVIALRPLDAYLTTRGSTHLRLPPSADPAERAGAAALLATGAVACLLADVIVRTRRRYRRQRRQNQLQS